MDLFRIKHRYDFGHECYFQLINFSLNHYPKPFKGDWSLLQFSISWNDYPSYPYLQVTSGNNGVFSLLFWVYKFGFDIDILSRSWNWKHLESLDDDGEI